MGLGNKLQRQKKDPWSLGERGEENVAKGNRVGKGAGMLPRERHCNVTFIFI